MFPGRYMKVSLTPSDGSATFLVCLRPQRPSPLVGVSTVASLCFFFYNLRFPGGSDSKVLAHNEGDPGSIPGSGRSPGEGNGHPLQYSCLENSTVGGAGWATAHGVAKSQTWMSDFTFFLSYNLLAETPFNICPYIFAFDLYRLEPHERNVESNGKNTFRAILNLCFHRHSTLTRRNSIGPTTEFLPQRSDQKTEGFRVLKDVSVNRSVWTWPGSWCKYPKHMPQTQVVVIIVVVGLPSHVWLFVTPWTTACQAFLSITNSWSLLKLRSI